MMNITEHRTTIESFAIRAELDGKFRFVLGRIWDKSLPIRAFLCANPSKADDIRYDLTAFKCQTLAANWGWGGFYLVNLYPNYSTLPSAVVHRDEANVINKQYVKEIFEKVDMIVIACGNGHLSMQNELLENVPPKNSIVCAKIKAVVFFIRLEKILKIIQPLN